MMSDRRLDDKLHRTASSDKDDSISPPGALLHFGARCSDNGEISGPPANRRVNVRRSSFNSPRQLIAISRPFIMPDVVKVTTASFILPFVRGFTGSSPIDTVPV